MLSVLVISSPEDGVESEGRSGDGAPPPGLVGWHALGREFPTVRLVGPDAGYRPAATLTARAWSARDHDPYVFDWAVGDAATRPLPQSLRLEGGGDEDLPRVALQILTRYQGLVQRRNEASADPLFERILRRHFELHDLSKPLVRADYNHALDVWQWVLRLAPQAGIEVQSAALFHDIERLASESDRRIEHRARDYQSYKDAHAATGAEMVRAALGAVGLPRGWLERVAELVRRHERTGDDEELALLNDADALSFFSLNSPGFMDYYGEAHTRKKIAYSLGRMRTGARERLAEVKLRADVAALLREVLADGPVQPMKAEAR